MLSYAEDIPTWSQGGQSTDLTAQEERLWLANFYRGYLGQGFEVPDERYFRWDGYQWVRRS